MRRVAGLAVLVVLVTAPVAAAKFRITMAVAPVHPTVGHPVTVVLRAGRPLPVRDRLRLVAIAPGAKLYAVLSAVFGARATRGGFEVPVEGSGALWHAKVVFPRAGRWRLVVPNGTAIGYAIPPPVVREVRVRAG